MTSFDIFSHILSYIFFFFWVVLYFVHDYSMSALFFSDEQLCPYDKADWPGYSKKRGSDSL